MHSRHQISLTTTLVLALAFLGVSVSQASAAHPGPSTRITALGPAFVPEHPAAAADVTTGRGLLVWRVRRSTESRPVGLQARTVDRSGRPIGSGFTLRDGPTSPPAVSFDPVSRQFLVAWIDGADGSGTLRLERLSRTGRPQGAPISPSPSFPSWPSTTPALLSRPGGGWLIAHANGSPVDSAQIQVLAVTTQTALAADPHVVPGFASRALTLTAEPSRRGALLGVTHSVDQPGTVQAGVDVVRLDANGAPVSPPRTVLSDQTDVPGALAAFTALPSGGLLALTRGEQPSAARGGAVIGRLTSALTTAPTSTLVRPEDQAEHRVAAPAAAIWLPGPRRFLAAYDWEFYAQTSGDRPGAAYFHVFRLDPRGRLVARAEGNGPVPRRARFSGQTPTLTASGRSTAWMAWVGLVGPNHNEIATRPLRSI